ncbi:uncharacterized protein DS421_5g165950 [Arachis hypogaea]|nr:uncharacterized protein DS421_5g165950 [Arachis hypogaea]
MAWEWCEGIEEGTERRKELGVRGERVMGLVLGSVRDARRGTEGGRRWGWKREREMGESAMMRSLGVRGCCWGKWREGKGVTGGDGGVKVLRSSSKNLEGGDASVITSSIFLVSLPCLLFLEMSALEGFAWYSPG